MKLLFRWSYSDVANTNIYIRVAFIDFNYLVEIDEIHALSCANRICIYELDAMDLIIEMCFCSCTDYSSFRKCKITVG